MQFPASVQRRASSQPLTNQHLEHSSDCMSERTLPRELHCTCIYQHCTHVDCIVTVTKAFPSHQGKQQNALLVYLLNSHTETPIHGGKQVAFGLCEHNWPQFLNHGPLPLQGVKILKPDRVFVSFQTGKCEHLHTKAYLNVYSEQLNHKYPLLFLCSSPAFFCTKNMSQLLSWLHPQQQKSPSSSKSTFAAHKEQFTIKPIKGHKIYPQNHFSMRSNLVQQCSQSCQMQESQILTMFVLITFVSCLSSRWH